MRSYVQEVSDSTPHDVEQHKPPPRRVWATRTARNSYIGMFMIGFAMALDFTASLMSIQPLYYITGAASQSGTATSRSSQNQILV